MLLSLGLHTHPGFDISTEIREPSFTHCIRGYLAVMCMAEYCQKWQYKALQLPDIAASLLWRRIDTMMDA